MSGWLTLRALFIGSFFLRLKAPPLHPVWKLGVRRETSTTGHRVYKIQITRCSGSLSWFNLKNGSRPRLNCHLVTLRDNHHACSENSFVVSSPSCSVHALYSSEARCKLGSSWSINRLSTKESVNFLVLAAPTKHDRRRTQLAWNKNKGFSIRRGAKFQIPYTFFIYRIMLSPPCWYNPIGDSFLIRGLWSSLSPFDGSRIRNGIQL